MTENIKKDRATYKDMASSTQKDWSIISGYAREFNQNLSYRILDHLRLLKDDHGGFSVDRLEHSLQTATRAYKDNRDDEYVICALMHDIGDMLGSHNHAEIGAAILKPFVSEKNHWMLNHHGIFQGYYFFDHLGLDKNMRDQFKGHDYFEYTAQFCHLYDQCAFDPNYESMSLDDFEPMVHRVLSKPKNSIYKH